MVYGHVNEITKEGLAISNNSASLSNPFYSKISRHLYSFKFLFSFSGYLMEKFQQFLLASDDDEDEEAGIPKHKEPIS